MNIFNSFDNLKNVIKNPVVTIGVFDGVHVAHQKIISELNSYAKAINGQSTLITFYPNPRNVLQPNIKFKSILTQEEKIEQLKKYDLQNLIIVDFNLKFSKISYYDFVVDFLVNKLNISAIMLGHDHHFGKNREGNNQQLIALSKDFNFKVKQISEIEVNNFSVSSTAIRNAIENGNILEANNLLGYKFFLIQNLIFEENLNNQNYLFSLKVDFDKLIPNNGVFLTEFRVNLNTHKGIFIADNKLDKQFFIVKNTPETFMLNNKKINIKFIEKISDLNSNISNFIKSNKNINDLL